MLLNVLRSRHNIWAPGVRDDESIRPLEHDWFICSRLARGWMFGLVDDSCKHWLKRSNLSCGIHKDRIGFMKQNVTQNAINGDMGNIYASQSVAVALTVIPLFYLLYWLPSIIRLGPAVMRQTVWQIRILDVIFSNPDLARFRDWTTYFSNFGNTLAQAVRTSAAISCWLVCSWIVPSWSVLWGHDWNTRHDLLLPAGVFCSPGGDSCDASSCGTSCGRGRQTWDGQWNEPLRFSAIYPVNPKPADPWASEVGDRDNTWHQRRNTIGSEILIGLTRSNVNIIDL